MGNKLNTISANKTTYTIADFNAFNSDGTESYALIKNDNTKLIIPDNKLSGTIDVKNSDIVNKNNNVNIVLSGSNNEYNMPLIFSDINFNSDNSFNISGKTLYETNNYIVYGEAKPIDISGDIIPSGEPDLDKQFLTLLRNRPSYYSDKNLWKSVLPVQTALSRKYFWVSICFFTIINRRYKYFLVKIISR